jgi:membrane-associated phospholipid phosphatase
VPTISGFERPSNPVFLQGLFSTLYALDKPHNLFPSLHITLSALVVVAVTSGAGKCIQVFYSVWLLLLLISVLLIHQHHIADIFSGLALAYLCVRTNLSPIKNL